jgi:hypothetical protein
MAEENISFFWSSEVYPDLTQVIIDGFPFSVEGKLNFSTYLLPGTYHVIVRMFVIAETFTDGTLPRYEQIGSDFVFNPDVFIPVSIAKKLGENDKKIYSPDEDAFEKWTCFDSVFFDHRVIKIETQ